MSKKKSIISLPLILSLYLLFINIFVSRPTSGLFSIVYNLGTLALLVSIILLLYAQVKKSKEK